MTVGNNNINKEAALEFIRDNYPNARIFVAKSEGKTKDIHHLHGTIEEHIDELIHWNNMGLGIYVVVNDFDPKLDPDHETTRGNKGIYNINSVWVDDDHRRKGIRDDFPLEPSVIIKTSETEDGAKYQNHWLTSTTELDKFDSVIGRMQVDYGGDIAAKTRSQLLRIPGFFHHKNDPVMVENVGGCGRIYTWEEIVKAFPKGVIKSESNSNSESHTSGMKFTKADAKKEIRNGGENSHAALTSWTQSWANEGKKKTWLMTQCMKMLDAAPNVGSDRYKRRVRELNDIVDSAILKAKDRPTLVPADSHVKPNIEAGVSGANLEFTNLPIPISGSGLEVVYKYANDISRNPNKEISIACSEHIIGTYGGGVWHIEGITTTRKRSIIAPQGSGKNTSQRLCTKTDSELSEDRDGHVGIDVSDFFQAPTFSFYNIHMALEKHRVRSLIVNEAGASGKSEAGDLSNLNAYELQLLSLKNDDKMTPHEYSNRSGGNAAQTAPIFSPVLCVLHESTIESYAENQRKAKTSVTGADSRIDYFFPNPYIDTSKTNRRNNKAVMSHECLGTLSALSGEFMNLDKNQKKGTSASAFLAWKSIDITEIEDVIYGLEDEINEVRNDNIGGESALLAALVRKYEKLMGSVLIQALADEGLACTKEKREFKQPVATKAHLVWAIARQKAIDDTYRFHSCAGAFADPLHKAISDSVRRMSSFTVTAKGYGCYTKDGLYYVTRNQMTDALKVAYDYFRHIHQDNTKGRETLIKEMLERNIIYSADEEVARAWDASLFVLNSHIPVKGDGKGSK